MVDKIRASATRIGALALGTSLSTPVVSGAVALVDEAWRDLHSSSGADPNRAPPELVKALLINSAQELGRSGPDTPMGTVCCGRSGQSTRFSGPTPRASLHSRRPRFEQASSAKAKSSISTS
jgi:hypothetical protein